MSTTAEAQFQISIKHSPKFRRHLHCGCLGPASGFVEPAHMSDLCLALSSPTRNRRPTKCQKKKKTKTKNQWKESSSRTQHIWIYIPITPTMCEDSFNGFKLESCRRKIHIKYLSIGYIIKLPSITANQVDRYSSWDCQYDGGSVGSSQLDITTPKRV